jgi:hypothetical protein
VIRSAILAEYFSGTILTGAYPRRHPQVLEWAHQAFGDLGSTDDTWPGRMRGFAGW